MPKTPCLTNESAAPAWGPFVRRHRNRPGRSSPVVKAVVPRGSSVADGDLVAVGLSQPAVSSRPVRRLALAVLVTCVALPGVASAASHPHTYYLALGDSLSVGVQPDQTGKSLETDQGYANQLFTIEQKHVPHLKLVKLGCPGDTTESMLTGHGNETNAKFFHCDRSGGSQLSAAERFLRAHHQRGEVPLVTIDIGANDVDGCAAPGVNVGQCVAAGEASIKRNLPPILRVSRRRRPPAPCSPA